MSFSTVSNYCTDRNLTVVTFESRKAAEYFSKTAGNEIWVGVNDIQTEGTFVQVDRPMISDFPWNGGEPNDAGGDEDCVQTYNGGYQDNGCNKLFRFGCKAIETIDVNAIPAPIIDTSLTPMEVYGE
jgi:Lectin C-type domain